VGANPHLVWPSRSSRRLWRPSWRGRRNRARAPGRARASAMLRSREVNVLFTVDLFNEGVDIPEADCILFLRPTESSTVFLQPCARQNAVCVMPLCSNSHNQPLAFLSAAMTTPCKRSQFVHASSSPQLLGRWKSGFPRTDTLHGPSMAPKLRQHFTPHVSVTSCRQSSESVDI
jgi:hypothetical protein